MKLSKLYSNKPFQSISFGTRKGHLLNVVLGDAKNMADKSHNLGKSKLGELLDFMLLKKVTKKYFFYKESSKEKFKDYTFYLEILLNDGRYLIIRRSVSQNTKIAFKINNTTSEEFILYQNFDEYPSSFLNAQKKLNELLKLDFYKSHHETYRRLVNYSLRSQSDYDPKMNTVFQLRKFARNKDKQWKPLLFNLLGFDGNLLKEKYELEEEINKKKNTIKEQEKDFDIKVTDKDLLVGQIQNAELEKEKLEKELSSLNFYNQDKNTITKLVGDIEKKIAVLNTQLYNLEYDISKLENSIRDEFAFDLDKVSRLFAQVQIHFPEQLAKSYNDLVQFNHQITQERNEQIKETLVEKQQQVKQINKKLLSLNTQKEQYRNLIQDTSLFKKYSVYQKKLIEVEKELSRFQLQLEAIEEVRRKREELADNQAEKLEEIIDRLKNIIDNTAQCDLYMNIRKDFLEIVKRILNEQAIISISLNKNNNIDFKPEFPNSAKDDGNTYYKILCVAFDLAILINYRDQSHFRFVYHDDVVGGDDNGVKSRLIDVVREIAETYDIQYIFSAVKDNIPPSQDLSKDVILELHDRNDSGKLFQMSF